MSELGRTKQAFNINPKISDIAKNMAGLRRAFHERPETGFEEDHAHSRIKELLDEWELPYEVIAETGLVITLEGQHNTSKKIIGLRADMDALNISEKSDVPWKSKNDGKMHACGHDGHMATMLTALEYLKDNRNFDGTVKVIFQPAEEGRGGAKQMIKEGLIENHKLDAMYAFHNWPDMPVGTAAIHTSLVMASNTNFEIIVHGNSAHDDIHKKTTEPSGENLEITLHGKGCHGAKPEEGKNPIPVALELAQSLNELKAKFAKTHLDKNLELNVTDVRTGKQTAMSVIPDTATITATIHGDKEHLTSVIKEKAQQITAKHKITATFPDINTPIIHNLEEGENPIAAAIEIGQKLGTLKDDFAKSNPNDAFVLSICSLGDKQSNGITIPGDASMTGTIRTYNNEIRDSLPSLITKTAEEIATRHGVTVDATFPNRGVATINDLEKAKISHKAMAAVIGHENIDWDAKPTMTAEDFGRFSCIVPSSYGLIGNANPDNSDSPHSQPLHNSGYDFNDNIIALAAQYFVNVIQIEMPLSENPSPKDQLNLT